ncbi:MAG: hypothetical protein HZA16_12745 [Nitrospirae bacterium]|nr:hypothetical protein [Nitrospirota bacterium]
MTDIKKFNTFAALSALLVFCILSYNVLQEYISTELGGYIKRRVYYEQVLSKKGLGLHKGKYWRKAN